MGHSFELQEATGQNPYKNSELVLRAKSSRKKSRVIRSQINDFHAQPNTNDSEDEEEVGEKKMKMEVSLNNSNSNKARDRKNNRYHVCRHCNRTFSSGRALGGHIRIHGASFNGGSGGSRVDFSYNSSTNSLLKPPQVGGSEDSDSDSSASSHGGLSNGCSPKMVSLYTLRNNPKRSSILMDPEFALDIMGPSAAASVSASASASTAKRSRNSCWAESNSGIVAPYAGSDLKVVQLPNWSVTKSRSCRGGKRDGFPKEEAVTDDRDTAQLLVMLAGRSRRNVGKNEGRESTEESVFDSKPLNLESQGSIEDLGEESRIVEKKSRRRKKKSSCVNMDGDLGGAGIGLVAEQHRCNTCKKVFNSHQALGGHRASHRQVKGCFAAEGGNQEEEEGEGSLMVEGDAQIEEEGAVAVSHLTQEQESFSHKMGKEPHRCTICHRVFGSGQALGGHKRCHWIGDRITETTTSAISTEQQQQESGGGGGGGGGGKFRPRSVREEVLDLNQPPPMDDDYFRGAAESVNQRVKMLGGSFANSTVDSFKAD